MLLEEKKDCGWDRKAGSFPFILQKGQNRNSVTGMYRLNWILWDLTWFQKVRNQASFKKTFKLVNYSGTELNIGIERTISLLNTKIHRSIPWYGFAGFHKQRCLSV